jgi:hypothetical protein
VGGVEPGALTSGFGVRGSRFGLPVWQALPNSAQCGVAGCGGKVGPNGSMRHVFRVARARARETFANNYMGVKCYKRGFGWGIWRNGEHA